MFPVAKTGGIVNWALVIADAAKPGERVVVASCETVRKRALVSTNQPNGTVTLTEATAYGVSSVFCDPKYRGRGYAGRLMTELASVLEKHEGSSSLNNLEESPRPHEGHCSSEAESRGNNGGAMFSVLWSDIGKKFYSTHGWLPFPSSHISFPPSKAYTSPMKGVMALQYHDIAILCAADEDMMRKRLSVPEPEEKLTTRNPNGIPNNKRKQIRVAIIPDFDMMLWHFMREDCMTKHLFSRTPQVRGVLVTIPAHQLSEPGGGSGEESKGTRVWAIWTRSYQSPDHRDAHRNTLFILRFVIEDNHGQVDEGPSRRSLVEATSKIINAARKEAAEWHAGEVQMWNPTPFVRGLVEETEHEHSWKDREDEGIASLKWFGAGDARDVDWVANEKYAWS